MAYFFEGYTVKTEESAAVKNDSVVNDTSVASNATTGNAKFPDYKFHVPYKEKSCSNCHETAQKGKLTQEMPGLCYNCHTDFSSKFKYLHGPVISGGCTECHDPHMSKSEKLLQRDGQNLCYYCHEMRDVVNNAVHADIGETNCTECHDPHGGDDKYIFRN